MLPYVLSCISISIPQLTQFLLRTPTSVPQLQGTVPQIVVRMQPIGMTGTTGDQRHLATFVIEPQHRTSFLRPAHDDTTKTVNETSATMTTRRQVILIVTFSAVLAIIFVTSFRSAPLRNNNVPLPDKKQPALVSSPDYTDSLSQSTLSGHAIAPKLGNETIKAELGRAAWKLLHTTMARFPDSPTADESSALKSYIHLFQRLYPCGECAEHFGQILGDYPPQVSSRSAAAAWACHVHNKVNESLGKDMFDCANIGDFYDCGCADEEKEGMNVAGGGQKP